MNKVLLIISLCVIIASCTKTATKEILSPTPPPPSSTTPTTPTPTVPRFSIGDGFNNTVLASDWTEDGKIICAGNFRTYDRKSVNFIVRLNADGSLDNSFTAPKDINSLIRDIVIQSDGKIIVGGDNSIFFRLNKDGSIDNTFNTGKGFSYSNDGYNSNFSFDGNGNPKGAEIIQLIPNKDGSLFVLGGFDNYNSKICSGMVKIKSDGSLDETFIPKVLFTGSDSYKSNSLLSNDNLLLINYGISNNVYRFPFSISQNGSIDTAIYKSIGEKQPNSTNYPSLITSVIQNNGKIILGGLFTNIKGINTNNIVRINTDGTVDETFNTGSGFNDIVQKIKIQNDGKILVAGRFTKYNNTTQNHLLRLNSDGSIDNTFNSKEGFNDLNNSLNNVATYNISPHTDGRILLTGGFIYYRGVSNHFITLINKDGTIYE
jgi:uncharacterized delta-60 repeat protein